MGRIVASALTALVVLSLAAAPVAAKGRPLRTDMIGANEVPGPGDPDGTGTARLRLNRASIGSASRSRSPTSPCPRPRRTSIRARRARQPARGRRSGLPTPRASPQAARPAWRPHKDLYQRPS